MVEHAITFDWLQEYESLRKRGHWQLDLFKVLPRFPYVRTGSNDSIYDTSIIEVADIPYGNSPYYVAYTRTWIFEPSVNLSGCKIKWQACVVAYSCNKLLASCTILAGISIPSIPWPMTVRLTFTISKPPEKTKKEPSGHYYLFVRPLDTLLTWRNRMVLGTTNMLV